MEGVQPLARLFGAVPFGSNPFLKLLKEMAPLDLLCHHAAEVGNYKSPDFDPLRALENNTRNLQAVLAAFKQGGGKAVVLSGTVFEPDEGEGDEPLRAFSPYGVSKGLTWQVFRYYCVRERISLGKFVIPNPFGPFEERRFTSYLMQEWSRGKTAIVKTPDYVRDNIPADLLAQVYAGFAEQTGASYEPLQKINPSCYVETQGAFALRVAREAQSRVGWACALELARQEDFSEPLRRVNFQPALQIVPRWDERGFWDAFVRFYAPRMSSASG